MFDAEKLLGSLLADGLGYKRKRRKSSMKWQLGLGALGVALAAFEHLKAADAPPSQSPAAAPPPPPPPNGSRAVTPPPPPNGAVSASVPAAPATLGASTHVDRAHTDFDEHATLLIRAMICAAHADGALDDREQARILERLALAGIDRDERAFLVRELAAPADPTLLFSAISDRLLAEEIYVVSRRVIDDGNEAESDYLRRLANWLQLTEQRTMELDRLALGVDAPTPPSSTTGPS